MQKNINKIIIFFCVFIISSCRDNKNGEYCSKLEDNVTICESYQKGRLIKIETFEHDVSIKNGPYYEFSSRGDTIVKTYYRNNKKIGGYYEYKPNKRPYIYVCFDSFNEDTMYFRQYDSKGDIISETGNMFNESYYTNVNTLRLKQDSVLKIWSIVIVPPKAGPFKVTCFMFKISNISDTLRPFTSYYEPFQNNLIYSTNFKIKESGKYEIFVLSELCDPDKNKTWRKEEVYELEL
jgi:hypothetical protein